MKKKNLAQGERRWDATSLDELIDEFTVEAAGDDERILAFLPGDSRRVLVRASGGYGSTPIHFRYAAR